MSKYGRIAAFSVRGEQRYGAVTENGIVDLSGRHPEWPTLHEVVAAGALRRLAESAEGKKPDYALNEIRFEIPLARPEKIICVGINYPDRNEEYKDERPASSYPSLFIRFPRSLVAHDQNVVRPIASPQLDYEGEMTIVIGKAGRHIPEAQALDHVAALTLCNEGSVRDWMRHGKFNVTQGKNFESSGSLGPWLVPYCDEAQVRDVRLTTRVNGELRQDDRTGRMIYPVRKLINYISTFTTLVPGDIIATGTPIGAGARFDPPRWLKPGDVIEIELEGVGLLRNGVAAEEEAAQ